MISLRAFDSGMASKQKLDNRKIDNVESAIYFIRGQRVMLDSDEQLKRNYPRFPEDFAFQLTAQEFANLKSQFATSSSHTAKRII
jgi:ORF6N domain